MKPRIAICLFGLIGSSDAKGGLGKVLDPSIACNSYFKHFCNHYEVDFYIHTWSYQHKQCLIDLYAPNAINAEKLFVFDENYWSQKVYSRMSKRQKIRSFLKKDNVSNLAQDAFRAFCRWNSTYRSFKLIPENKLHTYSYILSSRLDLEFFDDFIFPVNLQASELLVSHWNEAAINGIRSEINQSNLSLKKPGLMDLWFGGKPSTMNDYLALQAKFYDYNFSPHSSSYEHLQVCGLTPRYRYYRGLDYELVRRHRFLATV